MDKEERRLWKRYPWISHAPNDPASKVFEETLEAVLDEIDELKRKIDSPSWLCEQLVVMMNKGETQ